MRTDTAEAEPDGGGWTLSEAAYRNKKRQELVKLNQLAWQAGKDTIPRWTETEGYPVDGSLHRCIQYKNIGLECNIINRPDNVLNFIGALFELFHRTGLFGRSPNQRCAPLKT